MEQSSDPSSNHSKRTVRRHSKSQTSMSDTESTTSQAESFHSPLRSDSPFSSDNTFLRPGNDDPGENNCRSIVVVDKYSSPLPSPRGSNFPADGGNFPRPWPRSVKPNSENPDFPESPPGNYEGNDGRRSQHQPLTPENLDLLARRAATLVGVSKFVREEPSSEVKKVGPVGGDGRALEEGYGGGGREEEVGGGRGPRAAVAAILKRSDRNVVVRKVALGFRVFEAIACLISFSVMSADRTQGWSGDSFDRYIEYRYCVAVNVIGCVYSGFQAFDLAYHLATGKQLVSHHLRYHFDFTMDQILAYLLMSASSSAATRVDDWISNWGGDEFTLMASASISISFLAFISFAMSSLVSGYNLCNRDST